MSELIISVSGLRGVVGENLTADVAARFATAFVADLPAGPIVVSRDGRASGPMLARAVCDALAAQGRAVIDADVAATPTTGVLVRQYEAAGGVQISASHNPSQYNGLKLFSADGRVLTAALGEKVLQRYRADDLPAPTSPRSDPPQTCQDTLAEHLSLVLATVDIDRIRKCQFRVLLDSNHGAGSLLGRRLLEALGCRLTLLGDEPNGQFAHPPEPTAENLADVCQQVTDAQADVGFCQDPDADRLAVIDNNGRYLGEEYTLALCLDHVLRQQTGAVVTNCSTSRMSQDVAESHGSTFFHSPVGEANVVDAMLANRAVFGGEGNGGPIDPRVGYVRDSFVGMALILDSMSADGHSVAQLANRLPRYEIHKTKVTLPRDRIAAALNALENHFADATSDRSDGLRLDWPDGRWLLIRASNTEPIVRIIAEAKTAAAAQQLCNESQQRVASLG